MIKETPGFSKFLMFCWNTTIGTMKLGVHWLNHTFTSQQSYQLTPITGIVTEWEQGRGGGTLSIMLVGHNEPPKAVQ